MSVGLLRTTSELRFISSEHTAIMVESKLFVSLNNYFPTEYGGTGRMLANVQYLKLII